MDQSQYGQNWYGYAGNNPLVFLDPTGLRYDEGDPDEAYRNLNESDDDDSEETVVEIPTVEISNDDTSLLNDKGIDAAVSGVEYYNSVDSIIESMLTPKVTKNLDDAYDMMRTASDMFIKSCTPGQSQKIGSLFRTTSSNLLKHAQEIRDVMLITRKSLDIVKKADIPLTVLTAGANITIATNRGGANAGAWETANQITSLGVTLAVGGIMTKKTGSPTLGLVSGALAGTATDLAWNPVVKPLIENTAGRYLNTMLDVYNHRKEMSVPFTLPGVGF